MEKNNQQNFLSIRNKVVLILGLGSYVKGSGVAAALFCLRRGAKRVIVSDLKTKELLIKTVNQLIEYPNVKFVFGQHRLEDVREADIIVRNPAVPDDQPAIKLATKLNKLITNDIGLFLTHKLPGRVVAVTGTRGKSTTATLIYNLLKTTYGRTQLGGNIGVSPLTFIDKMRPWDITVLELSSWLLHDLNKPQFDVAVITNILSDHLNRYNSLNEYQEDKEKIWRWQKKGDFLLLNTADKKVAAMAARAPSHEIWICPDAQRKHLDHDKHHACIFKGKIYVSGEEVASVKDIKLLGAHNNFNVLAAVTVAKIFGVPNQNISRALRVFKGLPNRLELIRVIKGVKYYNDTTATMPDATIAALNSFPKKAILIAGGNSKGLNLSALAQLLLKKVKKLFLLKGNANAPLKNVFKNYTETENVEAAVKLAAQFARAGDIVLLSPGCSWLPKMNEFERGRRFTTAVKKL